MRERILRRLSAVVAVGEGQALGERAVEAGLLTAGQLRACEEEAAARPGVTLRAILQERAGIAAQALDVLEDLLRREADGRRIGSRYRIDAEIGRGGMGVVHRAFDLQLRRSVAVKFLRPDVASVPGAVERMKREAAAAARLNHPNIPAVHDVGESGGAPYLVMEIVEGPDLDEALSSRTLGRRARVEILEKVARAVHHAHEHGIVHRDLKPANVRLDAAGEPHVLDFGLAHLAEGTGPLTRPGVPYGTPFYMAPEQIRATSPADARTDVYGLGVLLYQAVAGRLPFRDDDSTALYRAVLEEPPPRPREADPTVPADLEAVVLKAIEKDPADRYGSARELADDLRRFLDGDAVRARPPSRLRRAARALRRRWVIVSVAALAVAAALLAWRGRASDGGPMADLMMRTLPALRELEEDWHRGSSRPQAAARLAEIDRAADAAPPGPGPRAWRALAGFFAGRSGALQELEAAAGSAGADPWPHLFLARAHLARYARSMPVPLAHLTHLASAPPVPSESLESREARTAAGEAARRAPSPLARDYADYLEATSLLQRGEHLAAGRRFLALRNHAMLDTECLVLAGISFALGGDPGRAAEAMEAAAARGRTGALAAAGILRHRRAYDRIVAGEDPGPDFQSGLGDFDRLAAHGGPEDSVRMGRGTLLFRRALWIQGGRGDPLPDFDRAWAEFSALVDVGRGGSAARYHRGRTDYYRALFLETRGGDPVGPLRRSLEDLEKVGGDDPRGLPARSDSRRELGRILGGAEGRGLIDRAVGEGDAAVREQPQAPWPAYALGAALTYQAQADESDPTVDRSSIVGRYTRAAEQLTRVIEAGWPPGEVLPVRGLAHLGIAEASGRPEALDRAIRDLTEALEAMPDHMVCRQNRAACRVLQATWDAKSGRDPKPMFERALEDFEAVTAARPTWGSAWLGAAQCREELGRNAEALAAYEEAWKRGVRGAAVEEALERLRR